MREREIGREIMSDEIMECKGKRTKRRPKKRTRERIVGEEGMEGRI